MNLRYLFILFTLLCFSNVVFTTEKKQPEIPIEKEKKTKTPKVSIGKRRQIKTLEEFIPSEEVSADKPVAFPNDI
ncbi:MAG: hypothetical protein ACRBDX_09950 [Gammaproteobacteria bacterium]